MFLLKIKDRDGTPLNLGDIVEISDGRHIKFFARVQWMPDERALSPFHTFSFHSVRRVGDNVECLPDGIVQCTEPRFDCWYLPEPRPDADASAHEHYLTEWRKCERFLESCFDIELYSDVSARIEYRPPEIPGIGTVTMEGVTTTFTMARPDADHYDTALEYARGLNYLKSRTVFNDHKGGVWMTAVQSDGNLWLFVWSSNLGLFVSSRKIEDKLYLTNGTRLDQIPDIETNDQSVGNITVVP